MIRTQTPSSIYSADDPLALAIRPPDTESDLERQSRLKAEFEAKLISDRIDEEIRQEEREVTRRRRNEIKLLLLGQAESGKSTLQKQFQLLYAPSTLDQERASWRTVVYFNVVRTIKRILEAVDALESYSPSATTSPDIRSGGDSYAESDPGGDADVQPVPAIAADARMQLTSLRLRLSPLCAVEAGLANRLSGGVELAEGARRRGGNIYVRSGWQAQALAPGRGRKSTPGAAVGQETEWKDEELDKIASIMGNCKEEIKELWAHPAVKMLLAKRKMRLEESAEFFLDSIDRVAASDYIPSTDDILRARLQTMGIASHTFNLNMHGKAVSWHLYDVGGSRGQRHTWVPYFDDAHAIIFIAPVSAFDQYLEEDVKVNRINDSLQLFTQICSNTLLKGVHLVLFLNKTDILRAKLASGVQMRKYITSYGQRPNEYEEVIEYFRTHFTQVHRRTNDARRVLYTHLTSVVDTKATQGIITNVRDSVFRGYLKEASLV